MSTVFDDFDDGVITDWTRLPSTSDWAATSNGAGGYWLTDSAGFSFNRYCFHTATGSVNHSSQSVEILLKWKQRSGETEFSTSFWIGVLVGQTTDGTTNLGGYGCGPNATNSLCIRLLNSTGSYSSTLGTSTPAFTFSADVWYWLRFRRETNGVFKAKCWRDGTDSEPVGWDITTSADTTYTSGYIGTGNLDFNSNYAIEQFGIGLGETAPSSAGGGGSTYTITADQGSYTLTGQQATFLAKSLAAGQGLYTLLGSPGLVDLTMTFDQGSYSLNGQDTIQSLNHAVAADFGTYGYQGYAATLIGPNAVAQFTLEFPIVRNIANNLTRDHRRRTKKGLWTWQ